MPDVLTRPRRTLAWNVPRARVTWLAEAPRRRLGVAGRGRSRWKVTERRGDVLQAVCRRGGWRVARPAEALPEEDMPHHKGMPTGTEKNIALVAHDNKKRDLLEWARYNKDTLTRPRLYATGTTGKMLETELGARITKLRSGPLGGDQEIGARIATGEVDLGADAPKYSYFKHLDQIVEAAPAAT